MPFSPVLVPVSALFDRLAGCEQRRVPIKMIKLELPLARNANEHLRLRFLKFANLPRSEPKSDLAKHPRHRMTAWRGPQRQEPSREQRTWLCQFPSMHPIIDSRHHYNSTSNEDKRTNLGFEFVYLKRSAQYQQSSTLNLSSRFGNIRNDSACTYTS